MNGRAIVFEWGFEPDGWIQPDPCCSNSPLTREGAFKKKPRLVPSSVRTVIWQAARSQQLLRLPRGPHGGVDPTPFVVAGIDSAHSHFPIL